MKLLLDTHIWLRAVLWPEKLSLELRRLLDRQSNELFLSPISVWEAGSLARGGRLKIKTSFSSWVSDALSRVPIQEASLNFAVAEEAARIHLPQGDLGDLLLAATASVLDLTLVTQDTELLACKWLKTLPNA